MNKIELHNNSILKEVPYRITLEKDDVMRRKGKQNSIVEAKLEGVI